MKLKINVFPRICGKCHEELSYWEFQTNNSNWCKVCTKKYTGKFLLNEEGNYVYHQPSLLSVSYTTQCQRIYQTISKQVRLDPKKYCIDDLCSWIEFFDYCKKTTELTSLIDTWAKAGYRAGLQPVVRRWCNTIGFSITNIYLITNSDSRIFKCVK